MNRFFESWLLRGGVLAACILATSAPVMSATQYVVTNDDVTLPFPLTVSFYSVAPDGELTLTQQVQAGGDGIAGGFFGTNRIAVLNSSGQQCVFASAALTGNIAGINVSTLTVGGNVTGSPTDSGASNGIGLAINGQYLYASFTGSNTIGTFQVQPGCTLTFINDLSVAGLAGGMINGMAIHGNLMIATYTDGSIQSFNISAGTPVSNGDEQYSTATLSSDDATYPNSIDTTVGVNLPEEMSDTSTTDAVEVSPKIAKCPSLVMSMELG